MKLSLTTLAASAAMAFAALMSGSLAQAAEVTFQGYTNGCFNCATPPNTSALQTASLLGLSFVNSQFNGTTSSGFLGIGGNPTQAPTQGVNNLGSMTLSGAANSYNGNSFTLRTTFTLPTVIAGGNSALVSAVLMGSVTSLTNGGIFIDFNNTPQTFTFSNGSTSGSFNFAVNDMSINAGQTASINGQITAAQQSNTPEPATYAMLGGGLALLGLIKRKRS